MVQLRSIADLEASVAYLVAVEPRFAPVVARHGLPPLRQAEPGLAGLLRIVTDQLISLQAGAAIWRRLEQRLGAFVPQEVLAVPLEELRALGLSIAKARTFHAAAAAFATAPLRTTATASEAEVAHHLLAIPGIGPWTVSIYLLTALRSADAWPAADLALQLAAQDLLSLAERPKPPAMEVMAEAWRPHRSAAALLLWQHYRGLRGLARA